MALALAFRPQVVLLLPAIVSSLNDPRTIQKPQPLVNPWAGWSPGPPPRRVHRPRLRPPGEGRHPPRLPQRSRLASYGGPYRRVTLASFAKEFALQLAPLKIPVAIAALPLLADALAGPEASPATPRPHLAPRPARRAPLQAPMSPVPHAHLVLPLMLTLSIASPS